MSEKVGGDPPERLDVLTHHRELVRAALLEDQAAAPIAEEQGEPSGAVVDEPSDGLLGGALAGESFRLHLVYRQRPPAHQRILGNPA